MPETSETSNPFNVEYPAGKFFVGREHQLRQLHELLNSVSLGTPSNLIVIGKGGEGKTSYLEKIVEESRKKGYAGIQGASRCWKTR
jgi:Cdc6-like AAA superfamily ATPase